MSLSGCFHRLHFYLLVSTMVTYVFAQGDKYLLSTNGGTQTWGHPVLKRSQTGLATTATRSRSWVDNDVTLPVGRLIRFSVYLNRIDVQTTPAQGQGQGQQGNGIWFQIWYALNNTQYRLLYQKRTTTNNTEGLFQVDVDDEFYLPSYCRLGWMSENSIIPISFDFVDEYPLYFRTINNPATDLPTVNQLYSDFYNIPYTAVFSVSVEIDPRLVGATGATGPPGGFGANSSSYGGNGSVGATGPTGLPGPPGPPGSRGYGSGNEVINDIDYSRCSNVSSLLPPTISNCSQVSCVNPDGSRSCTCFTGFVLASDARTCQDYDECSVRNGGCSYDCFNVIGSYYCSCPKGLILSNDTEDCLDVNECLNVKCDQICINTFGNYSCIKIQNALIPLQEISNDDQDRSVALSSSSATTTGILIWVSILTLAILLLALVFLSRWRRQGPRDQGGVPDKAPASSGTSFDAEEQESIEADDVSSVNAFSDWKFSINGGMTSSSAKRPACIARGALTSITSLHPDNGQSSRL